MVVSQSWSKSSIMSQELLQDDWPENYSRFLIEISLSNLNIFVRTFHLISFLSQLISGCTFTAELASPTVSDKCYPGSAKNALSKLPILFLKMNSTSYQS